MTVKNENDKTVTLVNMQIILLYCITKFDFCFVSKSS